MYGYRNARLSSKRFSYLVQKDVHRNEPPTSRSNYHLVQRLICTSSIPWQRVWEEAWATPLQQLSKLGAAEGVRHGAHVRVPF